MTDERRVMVVEAVVERERLQNLEVIGVVELAWIRGYEVIQTILSRLVRVWKFNEVRFSNFFTKKGVKTA